jgi:protein-disulfide isomerase
MRVPEAFVAALTLLSCASVPHPTTSVREQDAGRPQGTDGRSAAVAAASPERAPMLDSTRIPVCVSPVRGRADALATVVAFGDYQNPFCRLAAGRLNALSERYGDDLRVVWKNFPLPHHDNAMSAAEAARAVYEQGGASAFWALHEMLLDNQGLSPKSAPWQ